MTTANNDKCYFQLSIQSLQAEADLGMFSLFDQTGAPQKGGITGQGMSVRRELARDFLTCENFFMTCCARHTLLPNSVSRISKSGNRSKTAYSFNAEFMLSLCTPMPENLCEGPTEHRLIGLKSGHQVLECRAGRVHLCRAGFHVPSSNVGQGSQCHRLKPLCGPISHPQKVPSNSGY